ncbi:hypothetical protein FA13DRAFT_1804317 [Coprinellus micaceus]|uniref:Uncharacterized protein n=1 Tax=Coprinellus micaceus TaxID=71717 RepID=A0A4Y7S9R8_COPMI|nr:hypothetical protein FA13DRAFT_1804317 [Coprinellus micaceus]
MSTASKTADSDLYGDIYSDDLIDFQDDLEVPADDHHHPTATTTAASSASSSKLPTPPASGDELAANANGSSTSYSAQIAQQFSAYKQDPAQERQPKQPTSAIPSHTSAIPIAGSSIASYTGANTSGIPDAHGTVFGKKPSEMHDSG